ncbi:MAG: DUF342 domain-containing protein [Planctomycetes bacterium]|nr:DUF342 domain-containing protein [Planctomycetota bacterium]
MAATQQTAETDQPRQQSSFQIVIASDSSKAWVARPKDGPIPPTPTLAQIESLLKSAKIQITDAARGHIADFIALFESEQTEVSAENDDDAPPPPVEIPGRFLIAEGKPATEPKNGHFEWYEQFEKDLADWQGDESINYYDLNAIVTIDVGVAIGQIVPAQAGKSGVDVLGRFVKPTHKPVEMKVDKGLRVSEEKPGELITEAAGRIVIEGQNIRVDETLDVSGDVDFHSGSIDVCVDVDVRGTVRSKFTVKTTKSLTVNAGIEAAVIDVAGDLTVRGGILGQGEGKVTVGGSLTAKFCDKAVISAEGGLKISKEIVNSRIHTNGELLAEQGMIIGGRTYAYRGISVRSLGSEACVETRVIIGLHPDVVARAKKMDDEIAEFKKGAQQIRQMVEPLIANMKRLNSSQREKATELMCKADEIEMAVEETEQSRDKLLEESRPPEPPGVLVAKFIHAGVRIQIGAREVKFDKDFKGPLRIEERKIKNVTEIVAVDQISKSVAILPTEDLNFKTPKKEH